MDFDASRAHLGEPDLFKRFDVTSDGVPLEDSALADDEPLLVFERGGQTRAFRLRDMVYHHAAQGELAGEPYVVSF